MAKRFRQTSQKRNKERARYEKQQQKAARRLEAKQRRATAGSGSENGETPLDLDGIQPGPHLLLARGDDTHDRA
jgi:hypothetical protein